MNNENPYQLESGRAPEKAEPKVDTEELNAIAARLDATSSHCSAITRLTYANPSAPTLFANRAALLRLGAVFLRLAGTDPANDAAETLSQRFSHEQLTLGPLDGEIEAVRHVIEFPDPTREAKVQERSLRIRDRVGLLGCSIIGFIVLFMLVSGIALWYKIFTGEL